MKKIIERVLLSLGVRAPSEDFIRTVNPDRLREAWNRATTSVGLKQHELPGHWQTANVVLTIQNWQEWLDPEKNPDTEGEDI